MKNYNKIVGLACNVALVFGLALGLSMAITSAAKADSCVNLSGLSDYKVQDDTHLVYSTDFDGKYVFTLSGGCDLSFADTLLFKTFSSFQVCQGDEIHTLETGIGDTGFCVIEDISKSK